MALDEGVREVLRRNLPEECVGVDGAPLPAALSSSPEATARAMDLMEMKIDTLQQELEGLVKGGGAAPAASSGRALMAEAQRLGAVAGGAKGRLAAAHSAVGPSLELPLATVEAAAAARAELLQRVQTHEQHAAVMGALSLVRDAAATYETEVEAGELAAAAAAVCRLEDLLQAEPLQALAKDRVRSVDAVNEMVAAKRHELAEEATALVRQSLVVGRRGEGADAIVRCRFRSALPMKRGEAATQTVQLPVAWTCLDKLGGGARETSVRAIAAALRASFVDPLFPAGESRGTDWCLEVDSAEDEDGAMVEHGAATLRCSGSDSEGLGAGSQQAEKLLEPLAALFELLHATVCGGNAELCGAFGREIWPRVTKQLAESGYLDAQDAEAVAMFEARVRKVGFVSESTDETAADSTGSTAGGVSDHSSSLVEHVGGLRHREAKHACEQLLFQARETLLGKEDDDPGQSTSQYPLGGGAGDASGQQLFAFPRCETSASARRIVELLRECVALAASRYGDEPGAAAAALQTVDELLDLFRVIRSGRGLAAEGPGPAALLHNDYMLLAHCCLTLGVEYRPALARCSFVAKVPSLRARAAAVLSDYTSTVEAELRTHWGEAQWLREIWKEDTAAAAKKGQSPSAMPVTHLPALRKLAELAFCCSPRENSIRVAEAAQSVGAARAASCVLRAGSRRATRQGVGLGRRRRP